MPGRNSGCIGGGRPGAGTAAVIPRARNGPRNLVVSGCLGVILAPIAVGAVHAGDPAAGRNIAKQCRTCHGLDGVGRMPNVPNLSGQNELYLEKELRAYRSGVRKAPQMSVIASGLSDEDIENLAAWYASIEITVNMPE